MTSTRLRSHIDRLRNMAAEPSERLGLLMLALGIVSLVVSTVAALSMHSPLGHDESVYALRGRYFVDSASVNTGYWNAYRAPGFPYLLSWIFRVHESVALARLTVAACSGIALCCIWAIGRRTVDPVVGGLAALLAGVAPWFVSMSTFVFIDGPGTMFSLLAVLAFLPLLDGRIHPVRLAASVVFAWLATLVRFGAPLCFGIGIGVISLIAVRRAWEARDRRRIVEVSVGAIGAALSVPVIYMSGLLRHNNLTPAAANSQLLEAKGLTAATGWRDLTTWLRTEVLDRTGSTIVMTVVLVGFFASIVLAVVRRERRVPTLIFTVWAVGAIAGLVVSVGLIVTNYLMIAVPAMSLASAIGLTGLWALISTIDARTRRVVGGVAVGLLFVLGTASSLRVTQDAHKESLDSFDQLRAASWAVRDQLGPHCFTLTSYSPQVGWYSGCAGSGWPADYDNPGQYRDVVPAAAATFRRWERTDPDADPEAYAILTIEKGKRQPTAEQLAAAEPFHLRDIYRGSIGKRSLSAVQLDPCIFDDSCPKGTGSTP